VSDPPWNRPGPPPAGRPLPPPATAVFPPVPPPPAVRPPFGGTAPQPAVDAEQRRDAAQLVRDDPAAIASLGLAVGVTLISLGSLVAGFRSSLVAAGDLATAGPAGFRIRLLAVFSAARIELAVAVVVAVALIGLSRPPRPAGSRRATAALAGSLAAYVGLAALVRAVVLISLLHNGDVFVGTSLEALGAVPAAVGAALWAAALLGRRGELSDGPPGSS
jgi:hypothetical protein